VTVIAMKLPRRPAVAFIILASGWLAGCGGRPTPEGPPAAAVAVAPPPEAAPQAPAPGARKPYYYNRVVVLAIGVSNYSGFSSFGDLKYPTADAEAVAALLQARFGFEPAVLTGPRATKRAIEEALNRYGAELGERDALIVYFAGHGQLVDLPSFGRAGYFVPHGAPLDPHDTSDVAMWSDHAVDVGWLAERARSMKAQHVALVADACFSGFMTSRGDLVGRVDLRAILGRPSRSALAASSDRQQSFEDPSKGHGYFTAALLEQLEAYSVRKEPASVTDLFVEVRKRVVSATASLADKAMTPQMSIEGEGEFVFLPTSIPPEDVADVGLDADHGVFASLVERSLRRSARRTTTADVVEAYQAPDYRFSHDPLEQGERWRARLRRFEENAALSDALAMAGAHLCLSRGLGTERDYAEAFRRAKAAHLRAPGDGVGLFLLGRCFENGWGVERNEAAARDYHRRSAELGSPFGKCAWAGATLAGEPDAAAVARCRGYLEEAGAAGIAEAYERLAALYSRGDAPGVERDPVRAVAYQAEAARLGSPSARLAMFKTLSEPPAKDLEGASSALLQAADAGFPEAQFALAVEVLPRPGSGGGPARLGLPKDRDRALALLESAARQDHVGSMVLLANVYAGRGSVGVRPDPERARRHLERAVDLGDASALLTVGRLRLHEAPDAVEVYPRDPKLALEAFRRAAERGNGFACARLGDLYECGIGVDLPDPEIRPSTPGYVSRNPPLAPYHEFTHQALRWYVKALLNGGDAYAADRLGDFAEGVQTFRASLEPGSRMRLRQPGEPTEADVLSRWTREDRASLLGFHRLGFGIDALRRVFVADNLELVKEHAAVKVGVDLLREARETLMVQYRSAREEMRRDEARGMRRLEIDPRRIDPKGAAAGLSRFQEHVGKMASERLIEEPAASRLRIATHAAVMELDEAYSPFRDPTLQGDLDAIPEWLRSGRPDKAGMDAAPGMGEAMRRTEEELLKEDGLRPRKPPAPK
jgi:TPR repeat protein